LAKHPLEERLFTLACVLAAASPQGLTKQQIFEAVGGYANPKSQDAVDKQFERDKAELRKAGIAIETLGDSLNSDDLTFARYRIAAKSFEWPSDLRLTSEHWSLLELAARAWNDPEIQGSVRDALIRLRALGAVSQSVEPQIFSLHLVAPDPSLIDIQYAVAELKQIEFEYRKVSGETQHRLVNPWRVRQIANQWVLLAADAETGEPRNFLLRRIRSVIKTRNSFFAEPTDQDIAAAERALEQHVMSNVAELLVEPGTEAWWHFGMADSPSETAKVNYLDLALLAEDLREFGASVQVISPAELKSEIEAGYREVLNLHG
jgi:proteasome accessory factor B